MTGAVRVPPSPSGSDFYATAAQILPVLFLASAVEFRMFVVNAEHVQRWAVAGRTGKNVASHLLGILGYVLTVAIGEVAALTPLRRNVAASSDVLIIGALGVCGVFLVLAPTVSLLRLAAATYVGSGWQTASLWTQRLALVLMWLVPVLAVARTAT